MNTRKAATIIEILVVLSTMLILIGLLLGAIQKVRSTATSLRLKNQTRQLSLAVLTVESDQGRLPAHFNLKTGVSLITFMLPKLDYPVNTPYSVVPITAFISSADPSYQFYPTRLDNMPGNSSFAFNQLIFELDNSMTQIVDGRTNTFMLSERYARCGPLANIRLDV